MRRLRRLCLAALPVALALWLTSPALAHALLVRSDPPADAVLRGAPSEIRLWFTEDVDAAACKIIVWDRYRRPEQIGKPHLVAGNQRELAVALGHLHSGAYLVLWTSVSAEDGHVFRSSFVFYVGHRGPGPSLAGVSLGGPAQTFPDGATLLSILAHWLELLAATMWVGAACFSAWVFAPFRMQLGSAAGVERRRTLALISISLLALILSSAAVIALQVYLLAGTGTTGLLDWPTWSAELAAQYGQLWVVREILALVALVFARFIALRRVHHGPSVLAGTGLLYLALFAASGHGASAAIGTMAGSRLVSLSVGADWLHFLADSLWLGGQIAIALALIPAIRSELIGPRIQPFLQVLARFGLAAYASIALYVGSGLFAAKVHIPSWYAFFNSIYGRTLIVKMVLIGAMMLVSALTVYGLRPGLRRALDSGAANVDLRVRGLLRWLQVNPVLGAGVLLATSVMFYYPVPAGFGPAGPSAYVVRAGGLTATVGLKPDKSGPNTITVHLADARQRPVSQAGVYIVTTMLDMVMGSGTAVMRATATPGTFTGVTDLGMGGHWRLTILIYRPGNRQIRTSVKVQVGT